MLLILDTVALGVILVVEQLTLLIAGRNTRVKTQ